MKKMKLSVWSGVFTDYYSGMATALYKDEKDLKVLCDKDPCNFEDKIFNELSNTKPDINITVSVDSNVESFLEWVSGGD
jgi:hypothetical protein